MKFNQQTINFLITLTRYLFYIFLLNEIYDECGIYTVVCITFIIMQIEYIGHVLAKSLSALKTFLEDMK